MNQSEQQKLCYSCNEWIAYTSGLKAMSDALDVDFYDRKIRATKLSMGLELSIQTSRYHYCLPRIDNPKSGWSHVEVGFPTHIIPQLLQWIEFRGDNPHKSVYPYVPVEVVDEIIKIGGGIILL